MRPDPLTTSFPAPFAPRLLASLTALLVLVAAGLSLAPAAGASTATLHPLGARPLPFRIPPTASMGALALPPASVNLRTWAVPVGNQGAVGSCVTWAIDYGMLGWYSAKNARIGQPFNPMYTYSQIHLDGGDNGSYPTDALDIAKAQGNDSMAHYSHNAFDWRDVPNADEATNAAHWKIADYQVLFAGSFAGSPTVLKTALAAGKPVAITIPVRPGFDNMGHASTAIDNDKSGGVRGYHEVLALGYDAAGLVIQNSWGTGWGIAGFGKLSWAVVAHDVVEAETITGFAADQAPPVMMTMNAAPVAMATLAATIPYNVTWTSVGAIAHYDLSYTVDGGASTPVVLPNVKATSYRFNATPGHMYQFTVTATDALGRTSDPISAASFTPSIVQESSGSISYSGTWNNAVLATASDGMIKASASINATATLSTTARAFAFVTAKAPTTGSAKVYVDGVLKATLNLNATVATGKVVAYNVDFGSVGAHSIAIVEVGTAGHPAVDLDGFVVTA